MLAVVQEVLLFFASPFSYQFAPLVHLLNVSHVTFAHKLHEEVEKYSGLLVDLQRIHRLCVTAVGVAGDGKCHLVGHTMLLDQCLLEFFSAQCGKLDNLCATDNRLKQALGCFSNENHHCLSGRFFKDFQNFICCLFVNQFGMPNNHHAVTSLLRSQTQCVRHVCRVFHIDNGLLIFCTHGGIPTLGVEVK